MHERAPTRIADLPANVPSLPPPQPLRRFQQAGPLNITGRVVIVRHSPGGVDDQLLSSAACSIPSSAFLRRNFGSELQCAVGKRKKRAWSVAPPLSRDSSR